ncbi:MAG TPA: GTP 3',8-cyclase MoaA [Syntrophomonas sp.]|nr:GTP 3',8-cyclase MoaA [Syntrophomonas sp.]HRW11525.1 GTP 3',8-cyclase MoaA [Syntrophomonas sp.]
MQDGYGREINYLRISVTDRCNLRCQYCMPETGINHVGHEDILSLEEISRIVRVAASIGIRKVRLTGGEPLVRRNLSQLVHYIHEIKEIDDIALTTNGVLFAALGDELKTAGLNRINFSLDSLVAEKFRFITRSGNLPIVLQGIEKALDLGLHPIKINTVLIKGFNDDEIMDFVALALKYPLHVRFIEFMPIGDLLFWRPDRLMTSHEIRQRIEKEYVLEETYKVPGSGPASYYKIQGGLGSIGFISPMSNHFCARCNRLRMTADGKLRACLYEQGETDLRDALKRSSDDEELRQLFLATLRSKPQRHHMQSGWGDDNRRKMYQIGG